MPFDSYYSFSTDKSDYRFGTTISDGTYPSGKHTILPFFGYYEYYSNSSYTTKREYNTYDIKKTGTDSYQISKTPDTYSTKQYYYRNYKRVESDTFPGSRLLESKFLGRLSTKGISLEKSYHICYDLEDYHHQNGGYAIVHLLKTIFTITGIFCFIRWGKFILDTDPNYFLGLGGIVGIPLVIFLINRILNKINSIRTDKSLHAMNEKYINNIRNKYYRSMRFAYGKEIGELLKEYSIQRAQSQGKKYY